jgi:hypothetical protein
MLESDLEEKFRHQVRVKLRGMVFQLMPTVAGIPDRMVLLPGGRIFLVEMKTVNGHLRPDQIEWHRKAALLGIEVATLYGQADINKWISEREWES